MAPRKVVPRRWGQKVVGPNGREANISRCFPLFHPEFRFFSHLWGSSLGVVAAVQGHGPPKSASLGSQWEPWLPSERKKERHSGRKKGQKERNFGRCGGGRSSGWGLAESCPAWNGRGPEGGRARSKAGGPNPEKGVKKGGAQKGGCPKGRGPKPRNSAQHRAPSTFLSRSLSMKWCS